MNNQSKLLFLRGSMLILALAGTMIAQANAINVIYINGIQNTHEDATKTRNKIWERLDTSPNHPSDTKKIFFVDDVVWNPIGWDGTAKGGCRATLDDSLAQDKKELFLLKTAEEKFAVYFKKIISPFNASTFIDQDAASRVTAYLDDMTPGTPESNNSLETGDNPVTDADMSRTQVAAKELAERVKKLNSAIVVAHSQGNLLANLAYAKLASEFGNDVSKMVRVVNVANASEFSVNNLNFTHAGDAALFSAATSFYSPDQSLETLPSRGLNWTRTTPYCLNNGACNFTIAPATFNAPTSLIPDQSICDEILDHSITETYLSTATVPVLNTQGITFTPNANRFVDRFEDFVYAAADSLSATGTGTNAATTNTIFSRPIIGEDIPLGSETNFYQYYFMGYASLGNPPNSPDYWVATQDFNKVRVKKIGGTATCADMGFIPALLGNANNGNSGLTDENGNSVASFTNGTAVGDYCDFQILLPGGMVSQGTHIAAIYFQAISNGSTAILDGSSTNIGRSVNGWNSEDTAGGFAFQFCAGTCDGTFSTSRLNDTGITAGQCYQAGSNTLVACDSAGAIALSNTQDGMTGRDANVATNSGADGKLGFSFAAVTGGCVQDNVTGLMWEVKTTDGGLRDWNNAYTNYGDNRAGDASAYATAVNVTNLCGYNDWRLPTADELQSIVDYGAEADPTIDASWFPNTQQGSEFWSASPYSDYASVSAWTVYFGSGSVFGNSRVDPYYVRLVRAGQSQIPPRYIVSADGQEVTDSLTKLIWRHCAEGMNWDGTTCSGDAGTFTHEAALQRAAAQAGSTGKAWRLPNIKELSSIADKSHSYPAIDPTAFPATPASQFWSASPDVYSSSTAWSVFFHNGMVSNTYGPQTDGRDQAYYVRLVRTGP